MQQGPDVRHALWYHLDCKSIGKFHREVTDDYPTFSNQLTSLQQATGRAQAHHTAFPDDLPSLSPVAVVTSGTVSPNAYQQSGRISFVIRPARMGAHCAGRFAPN